MVCAYVFGDHGTSLLGHNQLCTPVMHQKATDNYDTEHNNHGHIKVIALFVKSANQVNKNFLSCMSKKLSKWDVKTDPYLSNQTSNKH